MKINNFILNSNYATLKNDTSNNTISVTVHNGTVFNPNIYDHVIASKTIDIGTRNAGIRARGNSSKDSSWVCGTSIYAHSSAIIGGYSTNILLWCVLRRISPTTLQLLVTSESSEGMPLITITETQTITFKFVTFLSPFNT